MFRFKRKLSETLFKIAAGTRYRHYLFPKYQYMFTVPQLFYICQCLDDTKSVEGAVAEIGCHYGSTTVFLNRFMDAKGIEKVYYAMDTFSGFVTEDIDFEVTKRGKNKVSYATAFQLNSKKWFDLTMKDNHIARVVCIETDVNIFDLRQLGPLAFVLLDVDLYRPIKKSLRELYEVLSPGGIILVDDCDPTNMQWDGSDQAYKEFMHEINQSPCIIHDKLGIVRKPAC